LESQPKNEDPVLGSSFFSREVRRVVTLRQGFGDSVPDAAMQAK
jgi:hypothetical protein